MLRDDAVALVQQVLGFRRTLASTIVSNMVTVQEQLEIGPVKPWFLLSEGATIRTTIGESRVRVPDDFLEEEDYDALVYVPDDTTVNEVSLVKEDLDLLRRTYAGAAAGAPEAYALDGYYFRLFPVPDALYLLRMLYYKRDDTLADSNVENGWLKWVPYLLIGHAGMLLASGLRDKGAKEQFARMASDGLQLLNTQNESRRHSNRSYQIGGPH